MKDERCGDFRCINSDNIKPASETLVNICRWMRDDVKSSLEALFALYKPEYKESFTTLLADAERTARQKRVVVFQSATGIDGLLSEKKGDTDGTLRSWATRAVRAGKGLSCALPLIWPQLLRLEASQAALVIEGGCATVDLVVTVSKATVSSPA